MDRTIRHADAVEAVLLPLLKEADLAFVQVRFLPGKVELAGRFDVAQRIRLDGVLDKAQVRNSASRSCSRWLRRSRKSGLKPKSGVKPRRRSRRRRETFPRRKPMICRRSGDRGNIDAHAFHQSGYGAACL